MAHADRSRKFSTRAESTWKRVPARASYGSSTLLSAAENISAGNMADSSLQFFSPLFFLYFSTAASAAKLYTLCILIMLKERATGHAIKEVGWSLVGRTAVFPAEKFR